MIQLGIVGPWQIVIIAILVLLLFGGKKIPELMRGLGQGLTEFKKATNNNNDDDKEPENKNPKNDETKNTK